MLSERGVEEVAHKGESKSLCVSLCSWLTVFIHMLRRRSRPLAHIPSHADALSHTPYLLDRYRESGKINGVTPSLRLCLRRSEKPGEAET